MADWAGIDDDTVSSSCVRFPVSTLGRQPRVPGRWSGDAT